MPYDSVLLYLVNWLTRCLPPTRCYRMKVRLYRLCGFDIADSCRIVSSAAFWGSIDLSIGADTFVGHDFLVIGGTCKVTIAKHVDIGPRVCIAAGTHEIDVTGDHSAGPGLSRDVVIEDGVWIGAGTTILGGVRIGRKTVVGAGSLVNRDLPPFTVAVGVPCRPLKRLTEESH